MNELENNKKKAPRITEAEKLIITNAYADGTPPHKIAEVLKRPASTIRSMMSRIRSIAGLPVKEKISKTKISGGMGLAIKEAVRENQKLGYRSLPGVLQNKLPNELW
jgi:hypothetical protein